MALRRSLMGLLGLLCSAAPAFAEGPLRVAMIAMPPSEGNPFFTTATTPHMFYSALYDTLTMVNERGEVIPQVATAWARTGERTWRFDLRDDVVFSNGTPVTADSVVGMLRHLQSDAFAAQSVVREAQMIASARALDTHVVEFTTHQPHALLPRYLSFFYVAPPDYIDEVGLQGLANAPVGSGPFVLDDWQAERILLSPNPTAWQPAHVTSLEVLALPTPTARLQAVVTGRVDVAFALGPDDEATLTANGLSLYVRNPVRILVAGFDTLHEGSPFADVRVRRAVNHAVNRKAITESLMGGYVEPASQPVPVGSIGYDPTLEGYAYDPDKARALLAEAGYPDGFDIVYEVTSGTSSMTDAYSQQIAADLAQVGIRMEIRPVLFAQAVTKMTRTGWNGNMFSVDFATGPSMDGLRPIRLHSCGWSAPWYCDTESEVLYQQAHVAPDRETRVALTRQLIRRYHEQASSLFLFPALGIDGLGKRVTHWRTENDRVLYHEARVME
jgi:peptide/nickel transport system substrate-binding protein